MAHPRPTAPPPHLPDLGPVLRRHRRGVAVLSVMSLLAVVPFAALPFLLAPDTAQDTTAMRFATNLGIVAVFVASIVSAGQIIGAAITRRRIIAVCAALTVLLCLATVARVVTL